MAALYPRLVVLLAVVSTPATTEKPSRRCSSSRAQDLEVEDNSWEAKATRRKNDKGNNNNRSDKGQYNNSGAACKRKPEDQVANVERNSCSKKPSKLQDQYEKILHKQCPMHPKAKRIMFQCTILRKSLNAPPPPDDQEKDKDKEDGGKDNENGTRGDPAVELIVDAGAPSRRHDARRGSFDGISHSGELLVTAHAL
ncbi:hypothetical protein C2845_PM13G08490 [Panicum miliaceum]|uniref:Uncharacterized protein n=1 Tax=Panicum miliaceum TaxID=4540 RepID=A0A3L6RG67_PANMI|nr:hypothetical protein C2845_PM13G08490 [Panicum miliaceum]